MDEYTHILNEYLGKRRNISKIVYKIMETIFRGSNNERFSINEGFAAVKNCNKEEKK